MCLQKCPRCGWQAYETLATHAYCINCNYYEVESEDYDVYVLKLTDPPPPAVDEELKAPCSSKRPEEEPSKSNVIFLNPNKKKKAA